MLAPSSAESQLPKTAAGTQTKNKPTRRRCVSGGAHRRRDIFAGTRILYRVYSRSDTRFLWPWIAAIGALTISAVLLYDWLFPSSADRNAFSSLVATNPALTLIFGPANDLLSTDNFIVWRSFTFGVFIIGIGAIFFMVRTLREQEDNGRAELLAQGCIGASARVLAPMLAALPVLLCGCLLVAAVTICCGGGAPTVLVLVSAFIAAGLLSLALGALSSQLCERASGARTLAIGIFAVLVLGRSIAENESVSALFAHWPLSPQQINPISWLGSAVTETGVTTSTQAQHALYAFLAVAALALVLGACACMIGSSRDFGRGIIPARAGRQNLSACGRCLDRTLTRPWGGLTYLSMRIDRSAIVVWLVVSVLLGVIFGFVVGSIDTSASNPLMQIFAVSQLKGAQTSDLTTIGKAVFFRSISEIFALVFCVLGIQIVMNLHSQEDAGRVEELLALPVSRRQLMGSTLITACVLSSGFLLLASAIAGVMSKVSLTSASDDAAISNYLIPSALHGLAQGSALIPAVCTVICFAALVVGVRPPILVVAWAGLLLSFVLTLFGASFKLPTWALGISPFYHCPTIGASGLTHGSWLQNALIALIACIFTAAALTTYRRRAIPS